MIRVGIRQSKPYYVGTREQDLAITFRVKSPNANESDQEYAERIGIDSILERYDKKVEEADSELLKGYSHPSWTHMIAFVDSESYEVNNEVECAIYLNLMEYITYDPGSATCPPSCDYEAGLGLTPGTSVFKDWEDNSGEKDIAGDLIEFLDEEGVSYDKESIAFNVSESRDVDLSEHYDEYYYD